MAGDKVACAQARPCHRSQAHDDVNVLRSYKQTLTTTKGRRPHQLEKNSNMQGGRGHALHQPGATWEWKTARPSGAVQNFASHMRHERLGQVLKTTTTLRRLHKFMVVPWMPCTNNIKPLLLRAKVISAVSHATVRSNSNQSRTPITWRRGGGGMLYIPAVSTFL